MGYKIVLLWVEDSIYSLQFSFNHILFPSSCELYPAPFFIFFSPTICFCPSASFSLHSTSSQVIDELYIERFFPCLDGGTLVR